MSIEQSVTQWIDGLRQGSPDSAQLLWDRYFQLLVRLADLKLPVNVKRGFDGEDVALSAFYSLCQGVKQGRFPRLDDRNNLWSLLVGITARKAMRHLRTQGRKSEAVGKFEENPRSARWATRTASTRSLDASRQRNLRYKC